MKKIFLLALLLCFTTAMAKAQNTGESWILTKVEVVETIDNNSNHKEIPITDQKALLNLLGPKELVFRSDNTLDYKKMGSDTFERFSYTKAGETLEIELSECLLILNEDRRANMLVLSEVKQIGDNHIVKIIYSYTK